MIITCSSNGVGYNHINMTIYKGELFCNWDLYYTILAVFFLAA